MISGWRQTASAANTNRRRRHFPHEPIFSVPGIRLYDRMYLLMTATPTSGVFAKAAAPSAKGMGRTCRSRVSGSILVYTYSSIHDCYTHQWRICLDGSAICYLNTTLRS